MKKFFVIPLLLSSLLFSCKKKPEDVIANGNSTFDFTFKGVSHHYTAAFAVYNPASSTMAVTGTGNGGSAANDVVIAIGFKGTAGTYPFGNSDRQANAASVSATNIGNALQIYISQYTPCNSTNLVNTDGSVNITSVGNVGSMVSGTFNGSVIFPEDCNSTPQPISGSFNVVRLANN